MLSNKEATLPPSEVLLLESILHAISIMPVTYAHLRYSHMEKALMLLANADERAQWPANSVAKAQAILRKWEGEFGPLNDIRADLFADGGRLEGTSIAAYWESSWVIFDDVSQATVIRSPLLHAYSDHRTPIRCGPLP